MYKSLFFHQYLEEEGGLSMHRIIQKEKLLGLIEKMQCAAKFMKVHAGQIVYYACVALVLTAIGVAAERFRGGEMVEESLILPAVELNMPKVQEEQPLFEKREGMTLLRAYMDWPEWNSTLCHWETHAATDYACPEGVVYSLSDGIIKTIGKSGIYGGFIEVETDGYLLRYASVEALQTLEAGETIQKGVLMGAADDSMPGEQHQGPHLHLELIQNGNSLDFEKLHDKKVAGVD